MSKLYLCVYIREREPGTGKLIRKDIICSMSVDKRDPEKDYPELVKYIRKGIPKGVIDLNRYKSKYVLKEVIYWCNGEKVLNMPLNEEIVRPWRKTRIPRFEDCKVRIPLTDEYGKGENLVWPEGEQWITLDYQEEK